MLTRHSSAIAIAVLAAGATVALNATPASAGGGGGPKGGVWATGTSTMPGRPATGGHGGGHHSGKPAPMPCPPGQQCGQMTLGAAPPAKIPTIDVAWDARDMLQLPNPIVHTSPSNKTYVQLRTGLWIEPGGFSEVTATTPPKGGTIVEAIAEPRDVTWNMGESTVTCKSAGSRTGTRCGYTYRRSSAGQPNRRYAISVTVTWNVSWVCVQGPCDAPAGDWGPNSTMSRTTGTTLAVGEVQTESRPG